MSAFRQIPSLRKGQPMSARLANALIGRANQGLLITGAPPIGVQSGPFGTHISCALPESVLIGKPDGAIDARTGAEPGTGTVSIWEKTSDGTWEDSDRDEEGWNWASREVSAGVYVFLVRHANGDWLIHWMDCG